MSVKYDLHIHSCLSPCGDAEMTPNNIAGMAKLCGLRVAALTDHNTSKNCPAFFSACERRGVVAIAGMELTTSEDIHMVCLFPTLDSAMEFDAFVEARRMRIKNRPDIFGEQIIMNSNDEVTGKDEYLLIPATELDITSAAREVRRRGGAAFPAHVDKQANGLISILGTFPPEPDFAAAEFFDCGVIPRFKEKHPLLGDVLILKNSDAHTLEAMCASAPGSFDFEDSKDDDDMRHRLIKLLNSRKYSAEF